jgi:dienelactone hydrolase
MKTMDPMGNVIRNAFGRSLAGWAAVAVLTVAAPAAAQVTEVDAPPEAIETAADWLALVDAGRYDESWDGLGAPARQGVAREQWASILGRSRAQYAGAPVRALTASQRREEIPGAPAGPYVILQYQSAFGTDRAATETVSLRLEDGAWRPVGYFLTPRAAQVRDYSAPADAPYAAEEVTVTVPQGGHTLAGTLTLPANARGRLPAVVLITGSGPQDRDSAIPGLDGYAFFRQLADTLGRRGVAVLRLDDRGWGASTGDAAGATSADFADDVRAAVAYLRTRGEVDPRRIGLVGHSEGGMIAPMVAVGDRRLRAVALLAAPAWSGVRVSDHQLREVWRAAGLTEEQMVEAAAANDVLREEMAARTPWLRFWLDHDPLPAARRLRLPVLILQGETDRQVTAGQAHELAAAIREGGNRDVTVRVFADVNHLFLHDPDGTPQGYSALDSMAVPGEVLGVLADWLTDRLR